MFDRIRGRVTLAAVVSLSLLAGCNGNIPSRPEPTPVRGLADFHSHQFAEFGFRRALLTHSTDPGAGCGPVLSANPGSFQLAELIKDGLVSEAAEQMKRNQCYPTPTNRAGQQMDTDSLKRAWQYGLRLLVVHAVNSEFLCEAAGLLTGDCYDRTAIEAQLIAAQALETSIDAQSGGPGTGWYRIVRSPAEARTAIAKGQLAVVLGVEASNAFGGCAIVSGRTTAAVAPPVGTNSPQTLFRLNCSTSLLGGMIASGGTARSVALLERYRELGARHFFIVHNLGGIGGGYALFNPLMHGVNNPVRRAPGSPFDRVADINRVVIAARLPINAWNCRFGFDGGRCNSDGLSGTGLQLARAMAGYGSVIDIDHLSLRSKAAIGGPDGLGQQYPLVSSHGGFNEISSGDKNHEGQLSAADLDRVIRYGGAVAPILLQATAVSEIATFPAGTAVAPHTCAGTTESWVQAYRLAVSRLRSTSRALSGKPAFVGVGFGSDFNGLAGWPRPRFDDAGVVIGEVTLDPLYVGGSLTPDGGRCYPAFGRQFPPNSPPRVTYPFTSPLTSVSFDRSNLPWSGRSQGYDISFDGVAHVGMIPDFVEELRVLGLTQDELEPLWSGAEAYIRTWEEAEGWAAGYGSEKTKGIAQSCQQARARLLTFAPTLPQTVSAWEAALKELRDVGCDYMNDS
jgi:microsomal dipeptidase-like Zn-dependent dipeptidase